MTVFHVPLAIGATLRAWSTTTTANVLWANSVQVNLDPLSVGPDVAARSLELVVERNVVYVQAVTIVLMIRSISREYLVMPSIIVQRVLHCKNFALEEHIARVQLPYPHPAQVCAYPCVTVSATRRWHLMYI